MTKEPKDTSKASTSRMHYALWDIARKCRLWRQGKDGALIKLAEQAEAAINND